MSFFRNRANYWSCSKIADVLYFVVGITKPKAETAVNWKTWRTTTSFHHPFVYTLVEKWLDKIQDFVSFPYDVYDNIRIYVRNRFFSRTHLINTRLKKGEYHEIKDKLLHGMFELLVNFIEVEKAHMMLLSDPNLPRPWWNKYRFFRFGEYQSRQLGLDHLNWEMKLKWNDLPTKQAESAKEQLELYIWWKDIRPQRPDPYDMSGWTEYVNKNQDILGILAEGDEDRSHINKLLDAMHQLEQDYEAEDERMLIRLINIRNELWT